MNLGLDFQSRNKGRITPSEAAGVFQEGLMKHSLGNDKSSSTDENLEKFLTIWDFFYDRSLY